jgi:hypothetical protein
MQQDARVTPAQLVRSRQDARGALRTFLGSGSPKVAVITGAAGMGKTLVLDHLVASKPSQARLLRLDGQPGWSPANLADHLAVGLGMRPKGPARAIEEIGSFLADEAEDGRRWVLAIDEAHALKSQVLDALRILTNRLGQSSTFAALILAGRTRLKQRLAIAGSRDWSGRPMQMIHLPPIDAEEASELVRAAWPDRAEWPGRVERWHAEGWGVPARILALAADELALSIPAAEQIPLPPPAPTAIPPRISASPAPASIPLLGSDPRPIRIEGDAVEVGWGLEDDITLLEGEGGEAADFAAPPPPPIAEPGEEVIRDPYAAIQADHEWGANQAHFATLAPPPEPDEAEPEDDVVDIDTWGTSRVRREGAQEFAPYSQLFSRARPSR